MEPILSNGTDSHFYRQFTSKIIIMNIIFNNPRETVKGDLFFEISDIYSFFDKNVNFFR